MEAVSIRTSGGRGARAHPTTAHRRPLPPQNMGHPWEVVGICQTMPPLLGTGGRLWSCPLWSHHSCHLPVPVPGLPSSATPFLDSVPADFSDRFGRDSGNTYKLTFTGPFTVALCFSCHPATGSHSFLTASSLASSQFIRQGQASSVHTARHRLPAEAFSSASMHRLYLTQPTAYRHLVAGTKRHLGVCRNSTLLTGNTLTTYAPLSPP